MAIIQIQLSDMDIRQAVCEWLDRNYGISLSASELPLEVKSKQNFKSEWEVALVRVNVEKARQ